LLGRSFIALVDGKPYESGETGFVLSGLRSVVKVVTEEGFSVRLTEGDALRKSVGPAALGQTRWEWCLVGRLQAGDRVLISDHRSCSSWSGNGTAVEGFTIGEQVLDRLGVPASPVHIGWRWVSDVLRTADGGGATSSSRPSAFGLAIGHKYGLGAVRQTITPEMEAAGPDFSVGLIREICVRCGEYSRGEDGRVQISIGHLDAEIYQALQRVLLRLGVVAHIAQAVPSKETRVLPGGRGVLRLVPPAEKMVLRVTGTSFQDFVKRLGISSVEASIQVMSEGPSMGRPPAPDFTAGVERIEREGEESVFDASIPGLNAFDANGFTVHNNGELPLRERPRHRKWAPFYARSSSRLSSTD
jgi:ribonucleoside-diphosphate reductase alpha chain